MAVYSCRPDEEELFERFGKQYGIESVISSQAPVMENVDLAEGCEAVCVITTPVGRDVIDRWHTYGVKVISTRTVGY